MSGEIQLFESVLQDRRLIAQFSRNRWDRDQQWGAEKAFALQILSKPADGGGPNPLLKCDPESIRMAMIELAFSGLTLAPVYSRAYLIPFGGVAKFHPGYKGLLHLVHRSELIKACQPVAVFANDHFRVRTVNNQRQIDHEEARTKRGPLTHVYTIATLHNGERLIDIVDAEYLQNCEKAASSRNSKGGMVWRGPFRRDMEIKSAIRHGWKYWPQDREIEHAVEVAHRADPPPEFEPGADTAGEVEMCVSDDQVRTLEAFLSDQNVPKVGEWMKNLAAAFGVQKIEQLPVSRYDEAMARLKDRYDRWKEARANG